MNIYDKLFESAKQKGIEAIEIHVSKSTSLAIGIYHGEVESFSNNSSSNISIRGIVNGHFGAVSCNLINKSNIDMLLQQIIDNAKVIEKDEPAFLFEGSKKYHKVNTYNKDLLKIPAETKKELLFRIEKKLFAADKRVSDVQSLGYEESDNEYMIMNSYGLKLKTRNNNFAIWGAIIVKENEEVKTGFNVYLGNDFSKIDEQDFTKKMLSSALDKIGGKPLETKKMKAILSPEVVSTLLENYIVSAEAENVQKHSSLFEGKLNTKIASSKLTVSELPLAKTIYARWFDDEGVATYNKDIIKNGVLTTYLYNLETARKDGVETTGNGYGAGSKVGIGTATLFVKPGKKSQDELFEMAQDGIYITSLEGANAGINPTSGNFSLKAEGFVIKDGKKGEPVSLITASGNVMDIFKNIVAVGNDVKPLLGGVFVPSIMIKSINIAGK